MTTPEDDTPEAREIELEIEVPGTPEEVWAAIATGPGISAWMHPTEVEEHEGGRFAFDMGSGVNESARVTRWEPPRRFATGGAEWQPSEDAAPARLATEWLVEARWGGTCVVRLVTSGFAAGADWDDELAGFRDSMHTALEILRVHLTHFPGRRGAWFTAFGATSGSKDEGWAALTGALGLQDAAQGSRAATRGPDAPALAGTVERVLDTAFRRDLVLRLDAPAPGIASVSVYGDRRWTTVQAHLYGDGAATVAAGQERAWRAWMETHFPVDADPRP